MNKTALKDRKTILGLLSSVILGVVAIVLAVYKTNLWIFFVVIALIVSFLSVNRAVKVTKN